MLAALVLQPPVTAQLPAGPVLVVGDGNSGRQIAAELAATRPVDLACSGTANVVPQRPQGRDLFWWLTRLGLVTVPAGSRLGRRLRARGELDGETTAHLEGPEQKVEAKR